MIMDKSPSPDVDNHQILPQYSDVASLLAEMSSAIAQETTLEKLLPVIDRQLGKIFGDVDFLAALYDPDTQLVTIPYAREKGNLLHLPTLSLGEGLTTLVIRTRQAILIGDNVTEKAQELGAKIDGESAKSWLGVPLLVANETIGALVIQDIEHEGRFTSQDVQLLTVLAAPLAIVIRNIVLLEKTNRRVGLEHALGEATARIQETLDVDVVLQTVVRELYQLLDLKQAEIRLGKQLADADPFVTEK